MCQRICRVIPTPHFEKDVEYYVRKKRFFHITNDLVPIIKELKMGHLPGDEIPNLKIDAQGHTYKVRVANSDTHSGKSNGYRVIYYAINDEGKIYLLTIYYKKDNVRIPTNEELIALVTKYCL